MKLIVNNGKPLLRQIKTDTPHTTTLKYVQIKLRQNTLKIKLSENTSYYIIKNYQKISKKYHDI